MLGFKKCLSFFGYWFELNKLPPDNTLMEFIVLIYFYIDFLFFPFKWIQQYKSWRLLKMIYYEKHTVIWIIIQVIIQKLHYIVLKHSQRYTKFQHTWSVIKI